MICLVIELHTHAYTSALLYTNGLVSGGSAELIPTELWKLGQEHADSLWGSLRIAVIRTVGNLTEIRK